MKALVAIEPPSVSKWLMTQPCAFNGGELCKDTVDVLKTCCKDVPTVLKTFYATCPPDCAMTAKYDLIRSAYGIHFYIYCVSWIITVILFGVM